jgi:hypothetical protein
MVDSLVLTLKSQKAKVEPYSDIFAVNGTNGHDYGFTKLIDLMGKHDLPFYQSNVKTRTQGSDGLITSDDVIIIKVNSQWAERGGTNTDLIKTIIEAIINHPDHFVGEIVVADNGQAQYGSTRARGSLDYENSNAEVHSQSVQKVVNMFSGSYNVSTYLWDNITLKSVREYSDGNMEDGYIINQTADPKTGINISYPKFKTKFGTHISFKKGIWNPATKSYNSEKLKVINVPVLKAHFIYGVTTCVKHYMGVTSDRLTDHSAHQSVGKGGMGTELAETRMPILNVLDAIWINANPEKGPGTPYTDATRVDIILAGKDPVAIDYWAAKHVLMQSAQALGLKDLAHIDPDNDEPGSFGKWLRLAMQEIKKAGHKAAVDDDQINTYVTNLSSKSKLY